VPDVLLSGHHERIGEWRRARSAERGPAASPEEGGRPGRADLE
jgi:tRNA G37 N-methylase TrmD